jgi:hypothetical protein
VTHARTLLQGTALDDKALAERRDELAAVGDALAAMHDDELRLAHYWSLAKTLGGLPGVDALKGKLSGVRHALWDAGDPADVTAVSDDLDAARDEIQELWVKLPQPRPLRDRISGGAERLQPARRVPAGVRNTPAIGGRARTPQRGRRRYAASAQSP